MDLLEYQGKQLFARHGVPVPNGAPASTVEQAVAAAHELGSGITGREGTFHTLNNKRYGTQVVSGVTPGKCGQDVEGIPVFNTFHSAVEETGANTR